MSGIPAHIRRLSREGAPVADVAAPEKLLAGSGVARLWNAFSDPGGRFHAGHWQSEAGVRAVHYTETELCVILEGRVRLKDSGGATAEFGPGDAFVIAAGFEGSWESIGRVTKIYAILEA
ncbi:MAG TPA: cupin domain-containing protein [Amaricoccus sp.]|uniref:cupin domain-containing protein n=1 Tax=Amaricoccus sp. TaxID=1872485 RepID=UPI002C1D7A05|nr:cupin domain-containing protein [Amaricoccus sp.]HMQ93073.1 cupin domain-containing protein [Amaricoccus sp.]HMR53530.1 cupin domain-containing protein [Amaricoccus sp.]HMR62047.1 cupin domain-containing protein [Amaricoccus sp.]HMU01940.1 cupin domain-containing protein [Amaricoccus sp.]